MTKNTIIQVKTAVGYSDVKESGENIGQGTIGGTTVTRWNHIIF